MQNPRSSLAALCSLAALWLPLAALGAPRTPAKVPVPGPALRAASSSNESQLRALLASGRERRWAADPEGARAAFARCLKLAETAKLSQPQAESWLGTAQAYLDEGRNREAAAALKHAERLLPPGSPLEGERLLCRAELELAAGKPQSALPLLKRALDAARARKSRPHELTAFEAQARVLVDLGRPAEARDLLLAAPQTSMNERRPAGEARFQLALGRAYRASGQARQALDCYVLAHELALRDRDRRAEVAALQGLARCRQDRSETDQAMLLLETAAELCDRIGDRYCRMRVLYDMGCCARDAARDVNDELRTPQALRYFGEAMSLFESLSPGAGPGSRPGHWPPLGVNEQRAFTALWLSYGMPFAAFKWTQKFKAQSFETSLAEARDLPGRDMIPVTSERPKLASGRAAPVHQAAPPVLLDQVRDVLPADTLLLEYAALEGATVKHAQGDMEDPLVCFRAETGTGEATLKWGGLRKLKCSEVRAEVESFRRQCASADIRYAEGARRLYTMLLAPIREELKHKRRLIVCPDGPLRGLPFHALLQPSEDGGRPRFLAEDFEIVYAYSASAARAALNAPRRSPTQGGALVVCDPTAGSSLPDLRFAHAEEATVRETMSPVQSLRGVEAREAAVRAALPRHGLIHFAGHTVIDERSPWRSGLLLAPSSGSDGILTAAEILDLRISAGLVVLSSCRTAGDEVSLGSGVPGLAQAFFAAGARSQLLTHWEVVDESTALYMRRFYSALSAGGTRGDAARRAAASVLADPRYHHPRYWAPFALWGDWR